MVRKLTRPETREERLRRADDELAAFGHDPGVMEFFAHLTLSQRLAWADEMAQLYAVGQRSRATRA